MADPTLDDPWEPHWLPTPDGLDPAYKPALDAMFAGVHPDAAIPHDLQIPVEHLSSIGVPDHVLSSAMAAPAPSSPDTAPTDPAAPVQPGLGVPQAAVDQAIEAPTPDFGADAISGGALPPTASELVDGGSRAIATTQIEPPEQKPVVDYSKDPLSNPDQEEGQRQLAEMAANHPADFIAYHNDWLQKRTRQFANDALEAEKANQQRAEQDFQDLKASEAVTAKKMAALDAQAADLANRKIDPNRWWGSRTTTQRVFSLVGAIAGGLRAGMKGADGRNHFLDDMQHTIDQDIDAQKSDIENGRAGLNFRRGIVADEFARTGNLYQAAEAARIASYGSILKQLQAKQMDYDPAGTTAFGLQADISQWQANIQAHREALGKEQLEQEIKIREQLRKEAADAETARHNMATEDNARLKKGAGTGMGVPGAAIGKPPNPAFPFATGYFVDGQTVWSRRQIGGKGEDPKERDEVNTSIREYEHVNDQLIKMKRIAQELGGGGKGLSESIWSARKNTLAADYDAAREAAISFMTRAIGDRPTQGQLELQAHRLPERQSVFSAQDPVALIDAQLEEADRAAIADLGTIGVDPTPVLESGKKKRAAAPPPAIIDEIAAAQEAKAKAKPGTPAYRDAEAELAAATARRADNMKQKESDKDNVRVQDALAKVGTPPTLDSDGLPKDVRAQVVSHNDAVARQQRALKELQDLEAKKPKPTGQKGTDLQVAGEWEAAKARKASEARDADRAVFLAKNDTLRSLIDHVDSLPEAKRKAIDELADKYGAPHVAMAGIRKAWMIHAATDENAGVSPQFRYGLLELLGGKE